MTTALSKPRNSHYAALTTRRFYTCLSAAFILALTAGCGGDDDVVDMQPTGDDAPPLSVTITSSEPDPTNSPTFSIQIDFSQPVTELAISDLTISNGTATNLISTDTQTFTAEVTPDASGLVTVDVATGVAAAQFQILYDGEGPSVATLSPFDEETNVSVMTDFTVTFDEAIDPSTFTVNTTDDSCAGYSFQVSDDDFTTCLRMSATPAIDNTTRVFTVTPHERLSCGAATYKMRIKSTVLDSVGNPLVAEHTTLLGFDTASCTEIYLYHAGTNNGDFAGRSGANDTCASHLNRPSWTTSSVAFISIGETDEIQDIPVNYAVPTNLPVKDITGTATIAADWPTLLSANLSMNLQDAGILPGGSFWWSGSTQGGVAHGLNCDNWTSSDTESSGLMGHSASVDKYDWIGTQSMMCSDTSYILCLAW